MGHFHEEGADEHFEDPFSNPPCDAMCEECSRYYWSELVTGLDHDEAKGFCSHRCWKRFKARDEDAPGMYKDIK